MASTQDETAPFTVLENPRQRSINFSPDYLNTFLDRFRQTYENIHTPEEYKRAQHIAFGVVSSTDYINIEKGRNFDRITPEEDSVLSLEGISLETSYSRELQFEEVHMRLLAKRINDSLRQAYPGSLLDIFELANQLDEEFTVKDCIEHCFKSSRSAISPD